MSGQRTQDSEENGTPLPRDLPDQQAQDGEDPLDENGADDSRTRQEREQSPGAGQEQDPVPDEPSG